MILAILDEVKASYAVTLMAEIGKNHLGRSIALITLPQSDFSKISPFYVYLIGQKPTNRKFNNIASCRVFSESKGIYI